jgi:hypothetical protein
MSTPTITLTPSLWSPTSTVTASIQVSPANPRPTLTADEAKVLVFDRLENNGGCQLPCLWGLTPGGTDLTFLDDFMSQFSDLVSPNVYVNTDDFGKLGGFSLSYRENNVHIGTDFSYYKTKKTHG